MSKKSVEVSSAAVTSMILHAVQHPHEAVHGVLLGSSSSKITEAVPVCHGNPTAPLIETALALLDQYETKVVGWYVSPRLFQDDRPGPAALKIVSGLATTSSSDSDEPVLLVVCNEQLEKVVFKGDAGALESSLKALGKDFGKQWLEPLPLSVGEGAAKAVQSAVREKKTIVDLVDHFEDDSNNSTWYTPAK